MDFGRHFWCLVSSRRLLGLHYEEEQGPATRSLTRFKIQIRRPRKDEIKTDRKCTDMAGGVGSVFSRLPATDLPTAFPVCPACVPSKEYSNAKKGKRRGTKRPHHSPDPAPRGLDHNIKRHVFTVGSFPLFPEDGFICYCVCVAGPSWSGCVLLLRFALAPFGPSSCIGLADRRWSHLQNSPSEQMRASQSGENYISRSGDKEDAACACHGPERRAIGPGQ